jgi:prepilin-type N-terminal cleavage/methylation domain-containing protein
MHREERGFTLIELLIVVVIVAIGLTLAAASYAEVRNKRAVTNAAEAMASFLQVARSESVKRNDPIFVTISGSATIDGSNTYCASVSDTGPCNCSSGGSFSCGVDVGGNTEFVPWLRGTNFELIQAPVFSADPMNFAFDPVRGIPDPAVSGNVTFVSENGRYAMRVSMTVTGRVEVCTVTGSLAGETLVQVGGYDICG